MTTYPDNIDTVQDGVPWWLILLTGIAALILGLLIVTSPGMTILTLVEFLGAYWLLSGLLSIVLIFFNSNNWGWKLLVGVIGVLAGLTILRHPITSAIFIPTMVAIFVAIEGILIGIVSFYGAFKERSWGLGFLGVLSFLFGLAIFLSPLFGAYMLSIIVGVLAIVGGVAAIVVAFRVR